MNNDGAVEREDAKAAPDTQARVGSPSVSGSGLAQLEEDTEEFCGNFSANSTISLPPFANPANNLGR